MSITIVRIVPEARCSRSGTGFRPSPPRASKNTNQPSFLCRCFIYVVSCAGPGTSLPFKIFNSTTCTNPDENVISTST